MADRGTRAGKKRGGRSAGTRVIRSGTVTETVWQDGCKYERPVMPRAVTLASFRGCAALRRGAGARQ